MYGEQKSEKTPASLQKVLSPNQPPKEKPHESKPKLRETD